MFIAVASLRDPYYVTKYRKPYKMCYIGGFIMKTIKENINSKEYNKLMLCIRRILLTHHINTSNFEIRRRGK